MPSVYDPRSGRWWTHDGVAPAEAAPSATRATIVPLRGESGELWLVLPQKRSGASPFDGLSPRQRQVAELAALGSSAKDIAVALDVGYETVRTHLKNIYRMLGVGSRTELARVARGDLMLHEP
ncbi:MAG: helix-turn-helix transcriptional regulator [Sandaracinaceae bacterium]|nr:helix-turn-helix transcriptional regulator [Sandaracinaceae bacterium]